MTPTQTILSQVALGCTGLGSVFMFMGKWEGAALFAGGMLLFALIVKR